MKSKVIYPGTFDPITNGHLDVIQRAARLFSEVIVAVAACGSKQPLFSFKDRVQLAQTVTAGLPGVQVIGFSTLLIDLMREQEAHILIRGVRTVGDFEYERQLALMNRTLDANIETLLITPAESVLFISSSMVREIAHFGGDLSKLVPKPVVDAFAVRKSEE